MMIAIGPALAGEIVELNAAGRRIAMIAAADHDDAALLSRQDPIEQPICKDEMPEMIDDELLLDAVHLLQIGEQDAGVENQHVYRRMQRLNLVGACDNGREIGKLQRKRRRMTTNASTRLVRRPERAPSADDVRASQSEYPHHFITDAGGGACHDRCLA